MDVLMRDWNPKPLPKLEDYATPQDWQTAMVEHKDQDTRVQGQKKALLGL